MLFKKLTHQQKPTKIILQASQNQTNQQVGLNYARMRGHRDRRHTVNCRTKGTIICQYGPSTASNMH